MKTFFCQLSLLSALTLSINAQSLVDPLSSWFWRSPVPAGQALWGAAYGNGTYVAVGGSSIIFSTDGAHWTSAFSDVFANLYSVTYADNLFVAVGGVIENSGTSDVILTSTDGEFWTSYSTGAADLLLGVTYGNGMFLADGYFPNAGPQIGSVVTSTNGVDWTLSASLTNTVLLSTTFGAVGPKSLIVGSDTGTFVAVGYDEDPPGGGQGTVYVSSDGVNWTNRPVVTDGYGLNGVAFGAGQFVAEGGSTIMTSTNALDWSLYSPPGLANAYSITYGNGLFVAGRDGGGFATSSDGANWAEQTSPAENFNQGVAYGGGLFVGVGCSRDGAAGTILTSPDGATWTDPLGASDGGSRYQLDAATFGTNQSGTSLFVAVGYDSPNPLSGIASGPKAAILTSPDGAAWTAQDVNAPTFLNGVANGNGTFVAVGNNGFIETSLDGIKWTNTGITSTVTNGSSSGTNGPTLPIIPPSGPALSAAAYGANRFVVVGGSGTVLGSADGFSWTQETSGTSNLLEAIAWNGATFVAVGAAGTIITSPDGITWTGRSSGTTDGIAGIAFGDNTFVAAAAGSVLTSPDGVTWAMHTADPGLRTLAWGGNEFVATALGGQRVFSSANGINWTNRINYTGDYLLGVAYGQSSFVVVGSGGQILQSGSLATPGLRLPNIGSSGARLTITGKPGHAYSILASSDLLKWTAVTNVVLRTPSATFTDPNASQYPKRFYRIVAQ